MPEYKQIFTEPINEPAKEGERYTQFYRLTLYEAKGKDCYSWPFMLKTEWGWRGDEDWNRMWEVIDIPGKGSAAAIRDVIKRLDGHIFEPVTAP